MKCKITKEIFDRLKQIVEAYPEMKAMDIAQMLCGGGYTKTQLSKTTIYYLKKSSSLDEYNEISNSSRRKRRKNKAVEPQHDLADELMADPDEKDEFDQDTSSSTVANNLAAIARLLPIAFDDFNKELASLHGIGNESTDFIEDISSIVNRIFEYSAGNDEKLSNIEKRLETTNLLLRKIINLWEPSSNNAEI